MIIIYNENVILSELGIKYLQNIKKSLIFKKNCLTLNEPTAVQARVQIRVQNMKIYNTTMVLTIS